MSWLDAARAQESDEDRELREELSQLLGLPAGGFFGVIKPTPKMIALADDLRREALRRRHTARQRPLWMLMAAGLPLALALTAVGSWGLQHKRRADDLANAVIQQENQMKQILAAEAKAKATSTTPAPIVPVALPVVARNTAPSPRIKTHPGELVIEVKPSTASVLNQTEIVKNNGQ